MLVKLLLDYPAQSPGTFTVNYPDLVQASHKSIMQVLVKFEQCFVDSEVTKAYLVDGWRYFATIFVFTHDS